MSGDSAWSLVETSEESEDHQRLPETIGDK